MKFKKRINGSWVDIPHYIHNTATDTITAFPTVLYPTGTTATVGLKGQTVHNGTPTPDNPIIPQGTGERTGNLFDVSIATNEFLNSNGTITPATGSDLYYLSDYISADNVTISVQFKETAAAEIFSVGIYDSSKNFVRRNVISNNSVSYENVAYIRINYRDINCQNVMLNTGSIALPYEPYGYKLDISCGNIVTPIYLGEVETTRNIKKLVLTGEENFTLASIYANCTVCQMPLRGCKGNYSFCTHIVWKSSYESSEYNRLVWTTTSGGTLFISLSNDYLEGQTAADFKAYLAAQYAAGTPVTVWYVLAEPTTGIVNEPLMKIGDYVDSIINVNVPTKIGTNAFNIGTTVQPSEVALHYHGWHPINNVHEYDNGEWN